MTITAMQMGSRSASMVITMMAFNISSSLFHLGPAHDQQNQVRKCHLILKIYMGIKKTELINLALIISGHILTSAGFYDAFCTVIRQFH